jgi:hypothetical protein
MANVAEQRKSYQVVKDFRGLNTKANRTSIDQNEFAWLENAMPIGFGNVKITPGVETVANVAFGNTVTYLSSGVVGSTTYLVAVLSDGSAKYVRLSDNTLGNIATANTFSNSGVQLTQWKNERLLFIDPARGYKTWDGTNLISIGSVASVTITAGGSGYTTAPNVSIAAPSQANGIQATATASVLANVVVAITVTNPGSGYTTVPAVTFSGGGGANAAATASLFQQNGSAIATFSGRVWIADDRTVYYSAADSYNDFSSVSAGNLTLTDATLRSDIVQILSANNFLYIFGEDSINVFSDVRVNQSGVTLFTNTNVSASVGSRLPYAIFPFFRSVLFMNDYGIYALVGSTTSKLSDGLDGIFPNIDFTARVSAGQVLINNILCAAFSFTYNDPDSVPRVVQAVFFEKKWFLTTQSELTWVTSTPLSGLIRLYGTTGTDLKRLYASTTANVSSVIRSALFPMGDPIRDKQALKIALEATAKSDTATTLNVTVDSENRESSPYALINTINWINNNLLTIPWQNNSNATIQWVTSGYQLYKTDAQQYGKYIGLTITSTAPGYVLHGMQFEHELRARF